MRREYPERPILGVGAVIFVGQSMLLVRRNQEPGRGQWSLPGGVVELGETLMEAIERELWEEVSIKIEIGGLIDAFDRIVRDRENRIHYHYVLVDYWGWMVSGRPTARADISDVRMLSIEELDMYKISKELKKTILTAIRLRDNNLSGKWSK